MMEGDGVQKMERGEIMCDGKGWSIEKWKGYIVMYRYAPYII